MSSDIVTCLFLHKELSCKTVVVKEMNGSDSSFIVSSVLSHCVKNKHAVFIVSTHHFLEHYQNISLKMNYNLQRCIDQGLVGYYNIGTDVVEKICKNEFTSLNELFITIKECILKLKHENVNIILDGVSHLFDLDYYLRDVNKFCKDLKDLAYEKNSFMLCLCNYTEDDSTHIMSNMLCHKADTVLEIENLPSGLSADVSGHLTVKHPCQKWHKDHMSTLDLKPSKYLYKLFDRGVKLFAPGTI